MQDYLVDDTKAIHLSVLEKHAKLVTLVLIQAHWIYNFSMKGIDPEIEAAAASES